MPSEAERALEQKLANRAARKAAAEAARREAYPRPCCGTMKHQLDEDNLFSVLLNEPFETTPTPPTVYALSDGGHGGMVPILFCPFCGKRFTWEAR